MVTCQGFSSSIAQQNGGRSLPGTQIGNSRLRLIELTARVTRMEGSYRRLRHPGHVLGGAEFLTSCFYRYSPKTSLFIAHGLRVLYNKQDEMEDILINPPQTIKKI